MKRAVIYARFSCSRQREASIEDQLRVCREWCDSEGYAVVGEYCDRAMSGRTDDRPEFQRMIANAGESDIVLVYMMDRFSRDVYDAPIYKKRLRDAGVKVVSATESMPDGPEAILIESVYEAMAAMESAHIAKRVKRGMEGNAMKCLHNGVRLYGYSWGDDGRYVINEAEAAVVREVFQRRLAGESINSIAVGLTKRGHKASHGFVYNMIHNEKYTGVYIWGDVRVEGGMPQIIDEGEWEMAQHVRSEKRRVDETWDDYRLTSKAVCQCGMNLVGTSAHGRGGRKYMYYRCSEKCGVKPIRADWLESAVIGAIRGLLSNRDEAMRVAAIIERGSKSDDHAKRLAKARARKDAALKGINRLMEAIAGGLDPDLAKDELAELKARADDADDEMAAMTTAAGFSADDFADFLQSGATLDDAALLKAFVWQVIVGDEDVTVILNYDVRKAEPARLELSRVRIDAGLVGQFDDSAKLWVSACDGLIVLRFERAA